MKKNILVCVSNPLNAEKLIKKGVKLAKAFDIECFVLTNDKEEYDELNYALVHRKKELTRLCEKYKTNFIFKTNEQRKFSKIVSDIVEEKEIEHIVIGHPVKSKWGIMTEGSIVNELFIELDDVDLHVVEVTRESLNLNEEYEKGIRVTVKLVNGKKLLNFDEKTKGEEIEAIFFQNKSTEFQNGILKFKNNEEIVFCKVIDGDVVDWKTEKIE